MSLFIYAKKGQWICLNRSNHNLLNIWNKFQLINNSCFLFWATCSANHACMDWPHDDRIFVKASQSERTWVSWYLLAKFGHCLLLSHEIDYSATLRLVEAHSLQSERRPTTSSLPKNVYSGPEGRPTPFSLTTVCISVDCRFCFIYGAKILTEHSVTHFPFSAT